MAEIIFGSVLLILGSPFIMMALCITGAMVEVLIEGIKSIIRTILNK